MSNNTLVMPDSVRKHYADIAARWHKTCHLCGITDHADFGDWVDGSWVCDGCVVEADNQRAERTEAFDSWVFNA